MAGSADQALSAAAALRFGDDALLAILRELERDRSRAADAVRSVVRALTVTLQERDGYTGEHTDAVHALSIAVGTRLGLAREQMAELAAVALLHDVGKIGIPDEILHKPGPLSAEEWQVMRRHPLIGERILATVPGLEAVARAVRHEHERWDGDGYPDGLRGGKIPRSSRIVLACDAWHALVSDRPYRRALDHELAVAELTGCAGTQFDPEVVAALLDEIAAPQTAPTEMVGLEALLGSSGGDRAEPELVALIAIASTVAAAQRIEDVIDVAADAACEAIGAASLSIERWLPERGLLRTLVNAGELAAGEERHPTDEIYRVDGDALLIDVLERGGTYSCSLSDDQIPALERELLTRLERHSCCAVPVSAGGRPWGQIWASRRADQKDFSDRDVRFLHAISGQIGAAIGRAEVFTNISEQASSDALTGLANRRVFDERLELAVLEARRDGVDLAVVLCDVDNLKEINDHFGHAAGDDALRRVGHVLAGVLGEHDDALVARIGGDEFAILLIGADAQQGNRVANATLELLGSVEPPIGVSCGVAALHGGAGRPADLMRAADAAQYAAKRAGRGRVFLAGPHGAGLDHAHAPKVAPDRRAVRSPGLVDLDVAALLSDALSVLDGPLATAGHDDRLAGVLRGLARAVDAVGWHVAFLETDRAAQLLVVGGRPGAAPSLRRDTWLAAADARELLSRAPFGSAGTRIVRRGEVPRAEPVGAAMHEDQIDVLLAAAVVAPRGGVWLVELAGDRRTASPAPLEPLLRVLVPEALRVGRRELALSALA